MCTLVVLNEFVDGYPLIVAGNRDERRGRDSAPPETGAGFICPLDLEKGGTWIGVADDGWFVGLTNQDDGRTDLDALSRGKVVMQCLQAGNHAKAARILKSLDPLCYNPFNMVFGRPGAMFLCRFWAGHELELLPLAPGINVISNDCWGTMYHDKVQRTLAAACRVDPHAHIDSVRGELFALLASHERAVKSTDYDCLCVHADSAAFGTRSSSIITVSTELDVEYWYSDGNPCKSTGLVLAGQLKHVGTT